MARRSAASWTACLPRILALSEADIQPWLDRRKPGQSRLHHPAPGGSTEVQDPVGRVRGADHRHAAFACRSTTSRPALQGLRRDQATSSARATPTTPTGRKYGIRDSARRRPRLGAERPPCGSPPARSRVKVLADLLDPAYPVIRGALVQMGETLEIDARTAGTGIRDGSATPFGAPTPRPRPRSGPSRARPGAQGQATVARRGDRGRRLGRAGRPGRAGLRQARRRPGQGHDVASMRSRASRVGAGFAAAALSGEAERRRDAHGRRTADVTFLSNNGRRGLWAASRAARTSSRASWSSRPARSLTPRKHRRPATAQDTEISTKGRHDPCVGIRAVPVGEAMMAIVLADHLLRHRAQCGLGPLPPA